MIRVLLIGDQSPARETLRALLSAQRDVLVAGEAGPPDLARALLSCKSYDAVFFDGRFQDEGGLELVSLVRRGARIVVVTDPNERVTPAFSPAAIDYLEIPVRPEGFMMTLDRLRGAVTLSTAKGDSGPFVPVRTGTLTRLLRMDEIRLVASRENYTLLTLAGGERVIVRRTMRQWQGLLPARQFARVHRGLFINLEHIARVERTALRPPKLHFLKGVPAPLEVKRRHWPALRARLELCRAAARTASPSHGEKSIAVLPFANLSRDPALEIFGDSVTEELINVLARLPSLKVAARTVDLQSRRKGANVSEVARELGVSFIVEGSVRRAGRRVRITAQLIAAADGFHIWSENFDRALNETFAIEDEIAAVIAANLQRVLETKRSGTRDAFPDLLHATPMEI